MINKNIHKKRRLTQRKRCVRKGTWKSYGSNKSEKWLKKKLFMKLIIGMLSNVIGGIILYFIIGR